MRIRCSAVGVRDDHECSGSWRPSGRPSYNSVREMNRRIDEVDARKSGRATRAWTRVDGRVGRPAHIARTQFVRPHRHVQPFPFSCASSGSTAEPTLSALVTESLAGGSHRWRLGYICANGLHAPSRALAQGQLASARSQRFYRCRKTHGLQPPPWLHRLSK